MDINEILKHIEKDIPFDSYLCDETDLVKIIKYYYFEKLEWCGCGLPENAISIIGKYLNCLMEKDVDPRHKVMNEAFGVRFVEDNDLLLCLAYELDRAGFTDHGSSIRWPWLTKDGEYFLWAIQMAEETNTKVF